MERPTSCGCGVCERRMNLVSKKLQASPLLARVVPFAAVVTLTFCQGKFGDASRFWFYFAKIVLGAWLVWMTRPLVAEMAWRFSWEAVLVGVGMFGLWVALDGLYPKIGKTDAGWNPHTAF